MIYAVKGRYRVYDGDTIIVTYLCPTKVGANSAGVFFLLKRIRFVGIAAPEIRTRDREEKARGYQVKFWLEEFLGKSDIEVEIEGSGEGSFAKRLLGTVYVLKDGVRINVNEALLEHEFVVPYRRR